MSAKPLAAEISQGFKKTPEGKMISETALAWEMNPSLQPELEKAWLYVGRFMWAFALIESQIDAALARVFDLGDTKALILFNDLDIRKKLNLIRLGLDRPGADKTLDYELTLSIVEKLVDIRNIIAHRSFSGPESDGTIHFEHVTTRRRLKFPDLDPHVRKKEKLPQSDYTLSEFDEFDDRMHKLYIALSKIASCKPTDFDVVKDDIAKIIRSSGNGQQFPTEDEDE